MTTSNKPKRKKTNRKSLKARCDKLWSVLVVRRDGGICQQCGEPGEDPHHYILRANIGTRFELGNGVTLCTKCHNWTHDHPEDFHRWFSKRIGYIAWHDLQDKRRLLKVDLEEIHRGLKEMKRETQ
jgi:5-methylcytosine-specific restriction endonuclease McrA